MAAATKSSIQKKNAIVLSEELNNMVIVQSRIKKTGVELGKGAFGRVFEVEYDGKPCAAKQVHSMLIPVASVNSKEVETLTRNVLHECSIWSTIRHPNVVQILGLYYPSPEKSGLPVMIMEKMHESVSSLIEKYNDIPLLVRLSILHDASLGLRCLHGREPPILHRDISPNNILLTSYLQAKISDLGVAKAVMTESNKAMTKTPGTTVFMPPEALDDNPTYGSPLDVFSFGGVIIHIACGKWPVPKAVKQLDSKTNRRCIVLSEVERRQHYIDLMTGGDADLKPLVVSCLDDDAELRPTMISVSETLNTLKEQCKKKITYDGMGRILWLAKISLSPTKIGLISEQLKVCFGW